MCENVTDLDDSTEKPRDRSLHFQPPQQLPSPRTTIERLDLQCDQPRFWNFESCTSFPIKYGDGVAHQSPAQRDCAERRSGHRCRRSGLRALLPPLLLLCTRSSHLYPNLNSTCIGFIPERLLSFDLLPLRPELRHRDPLRPTTPPCHRVRPSLILLKFTRLFHQIWLAHLFCF